MAQADVNDAINDKDIFDKDSVSTDFQSAIAQALNDLSATSENLQVRGSCFRSNHVDPLFI